MSLEILVLDALPPLSRRRLCDMRLSIQRWLVLAYPADPTLRLPPPPPSNTLAGGRR